MMGREPEKPIGREAAARLVIIQEQDFVTARQLHAFLARELGFPDYYGGNFAALADCLGDIDSTTRIVLMPDRDTRKAHWFDTFVSVIVRAAEDNPFLAVTRHVVKP